MDAQGFSDLFIFLISRTIQYLTYWCIWLTSHTIQYLTIFAYGLLALYPSVRYMLCLLMSIIIHIVQYLTNFAYGLLINTLIQYLLCYNALSFNIRLLFTTQIYDLSCCMSYNSMSVFQLRFRIYPVVYPTIQYRIS